MRLPFIALGLPVLLAGCALGPGPNAPTPRPVIDLVASPFGVAAPTFTLSGPPSPAIIAVRLRLPYRPLAKTIAADLKSLTFGLVACATGASPAGDTGLVPVGSLFSYNTQAATGSLSFGNVPANAEGESYHVVVAAFDDVGGTGANITNTTGTDAATGRVRLGGIPGAFYISTGAVRVTPITNAVSGGSPIELALKLQD